MLRAPIGSPGSIGPEGDWGEVMGDIKVTGDLIPTPRGKARIYRLKTPSVNEKVVRALARQLGMQADAKSGTLRNDTNKLTYSQGLLELTMYRASGGIRF